MAFIEKCCEVCGEHVGYNKRFDQLSCNNSVQVCRTCKPLFRGARHSFSWREKDPERFDNGSTDFQLYVPDIPGGVGGMYWRWSYDKSDTLKKLRRLLRVKRLNTGELV